MTKRQYVQNANFFCSYSENKYCMNKLKKNKTCILSFIEKVGYFISTEKTDAEVD